MFDTLKLLLFLFTCYILLSMVNKFADMPVVMEITQWNN